MNRPKRPIGKAEIVYWISVVGGIASILALVGPWVMPGDWRAIYVAVSSAVYILVLLAIETYLIIQRSRLIVQQDGLLRQRDEALARAEAAESCREVFEPLHSLFHRLRDVIFGLQTSPGNPEETYDEAFCEHVLNITQAVFQKVTGVRCSTCIKTFDGDQETVYTLQRDSMSAADRGDIDIGRVSRLSENTDFERIVRGTDRYFLCNDLLDLAKSGLYRNDRPDWAEHYRSALVLPIRCYDTALRRHQIFGFLCVDSMQVGIFDRQLSVQMGACIADMVYVYFSTVDKLRESTQVG